VALRALVAGGVLGVLLVLATAAGAKEGVVARVLTPIARDAEPGSKVTVAWTLTYVEAGKRRPFGAGYVFARLVGPGGSRTPLAYGVHTRRPAGYRATVRVPRGGARRLQIGVMGTVCDAEGCRSAPKLFPIRGRVFD
jgi:hypothetical protein